MSHTFSVKAAIQKNAYSWFRNFSNEVALHIIIFSVSALGDTYEVKVQTKIRL